MCHGTILNQANTITSIQIVLYSIIEKKSGINLQLEFRYGKSSLGWMDDSML